MPEIYDKWIHLKPKHAGQSKNLLGIVYIISGMNINMQTPLIKRQYEIMSLDISYFDLYSNWVFMVWARQNSCLKLEIVVWVDKQTEDCMVEYCIHWILNTATVHTEWWTKHREDSTPYLIRHAVNFHAIQLMKWNNLKPVIKLIFSSTPDFPMNLLFPLR